MAIVSFKMNREVGEVEMSHRKPGPRLGCSGLGCYEGVESVDKSGDAYSGPPARTDTRLLRHRSLTGRNKWW